MTSVTTSQFTLNFEPSLPEKFPTLREYVAFRAAAKGQKGIAADMDIAPSTLSRKLNPSDGDTQRFNIDDLESYLRCTKDAAAIIEYLAAKYLDNDDARKARVLSKLEALMPDLVQAMADLKAAA